MKPPKTFSVALTLLLLSLATSQARLGENLKDLKKRYGQPIDADGSTEVGADHYVFRWYSYQVSVIIRDGWSVSETFTRNDHKDFSLSDVHDLLVESSDPGLSWTQVDGSTWRQQDRVATWAARSLTVEEKARTLGKRRR
jgi:hypothetical protein